MNTGQTAQNATGNRITFTSQALPNGTVSIGGGTNTGTGTTIISASQLPTTTTIKTITSSAAAAGAHHSLPQQVQVQHHQVLQTTTTTAHTNAHHQHQHHHQQQQQQQQQQHQAQLNAAAQSVGATQTQTLVIKSNHHAVSLPAGLVSSAPGIVTMTKTLNQNNQPILNSMIPASVVVGMRSPAPQQQQKSGVSGSPLGRVVIGSPHMGVGARPQSPAITLSTLTPGQTSALLLKTENGLQLLRLNTTGSTGQVTTQTIGNNSGGGTNSSNPTQIRLQTVPAAVSRFSAPPIALRKTIVRSSTTTSNTTTTTSTQQQHQQLQLQQKAHQQQQSQQHHALQQQATTMKQNKQNSIAVSTGTTIVNHSVASTNSSHVYTTPANITSISQHQHQQQQQQQQLQIQQQTQHLNAQPQITQIQTIPAHSMQHQQQGTTNQTHSVGNVTQVNTSSNSGMVTNASPAATTTTTTTQNTAAQGNTKEKCRKFLANLIDLSTREPKPVEKNVRNLIQELVNANVEPEEFCDRLERLLNASPQPCLIGFLKKSLPLLRHALYTKELFIEGIKPPPQHVVGIATLHQLPKIQAQIRPISQNQTVTIGQTQVRMVTPSLPMPRPVHRALANQQTVRSPSPNNGQRLVTTATIRGPVIQPILSSHTGITTIRQTAPVSGPVPRPNAVQIRPTRPKGGLVKIGHPQGKTISTITSTQPPSLTAISANSGVSGNFATQSSILSTINSVASAGSGGISSSLTSGSSNTMLPTPSLPTVQLPVAITGSAIGDKSLSSQDATKSAIEKTIALSGIKAGIKTINATQNKAASKKKKEQIEKDKDEKSSALSTTLTTTASSSFFQQPSLSLSSTVYGDDDINDVAAMGGVNLAEESQRIMGCTENIGTQIRSCKDEVFLHLPALQARLRARMLQERMEEPGQEVAVLLSHACQERLKNIVEQLAVIAEHRNDVIKLDPRYEVSKDVRGQIKFLEELDKAEQKRHEEVEREMLLRAAKSRSKIEDPEQAKMKARAKEMQRVEMEELRQRDANMTALQAIGPRKKIKIEGDTTGTGVSTTGSSLMVGSGTTPAPLRPRIKRVNLRDMLFFMEQDRDLCRSENLYGAYLK